MLQTFEELLEQHKADVQGKSNVEKGHLEKFLTNEVRKTTQLKCTFPKTEKYIKRFSRKLPTLRASPRKHVFSHIDLYKTLFEQWKKYDKEVVRDQIPSSPEG
jgi:hypothetical protein